MPWDFHRRSYAYMTPAFTKTIARFAKLTKTAAIAAPANTAIVKTFAASRETVFDGSGRSGWLTRSVSTSNRSFIAFPPAVNNAAARAARPIDTGRALHDESPPTATVPMRTPAADMRQFTGLASARSPRIPIGQSLLRVIGLSRIGTLVTLRAGPLSGARADWTCATNHR